MVSFVKITRPSPKVSELWFLLKKKELLGLSKIPLITLLVGEEFLLTRELKKINK